MSDQVRKWKDDAAKFMRKGKYAKSLDLYKKVLETAPDDLTCHNNVGYILRKLGRDQEAVEVFEQLAKSYAEKSYLLKAIATCKVVLEIDPDHTSTQQMLADFYAKQSGKSSPEIKVIADDEDKSQVGGSAVVPLTPIPIDMGVSQDFAQSFESTASTPVEEITTSDQPAAQMSYGEIDLQVVEQPALDQPDVELEAEYLDNSAAAQEAEELNLDDIESQEPAQDADFDLDMEVAEPSGHEETLPKIPLFSDLEPDAFVAVLERMKLVRANPGDWIIKEGAQGESMFIVASGGVRVLKSIDEKKMFQLAALGEGSFFGEMAVLKSGKRGASVQATKPSELFEISRELLSQVVKQYPSVDKVLKKFVTQRLLRNVMTTSEIFKPFSKEERVHIIQRFVSRDVEPGDLVISEGEESNGFYIVLQGTMKVMIKADDGTVLKVGELTEGEVFGEISCLNKEPAMATVLASTPGSVLRLPRKDFDALVMSHPQILEMVGQLSDERRSITVNTLAEKGILI
jgi:CRP-like cAMP-binding protein